MSPTMLPKGSSTGRGLEAGFAFDEGLVFFRAQLLRALERAGEVVHDRIVYLILCGRVVRLKRDRRS
jgi:hypothetical protein